MNKYQYKTFSGNTFDRLTVLGPDKQKNSEKGLFKENLNKTFWICKCECGTVTSTYGCSLTGGHSKSCGCYQKQVCLKNIKNPIRILPNQEGPKKRVFRQYKYHAKKKGVPFELNFEHFCSLIITNCFYCGEVPKNQSSSDRTKSVILLYNGIDRIQCDKGYTLTNIVSCCKRCNIAKNDMSLEEFYYWIKHLCSNSENILTALNLKFYVPKS